VVDSVLVVAAVAELQSDPRCAPGRPPPGSRCLPAWQVSSDVVSPHL